MSNFNLTIFDLIEHIFNFTHDNTSMHFLYSLNNTSILLSKCNGVTHNALLVFPTLVDIIKCSDDLLTDMQIPIDNEHQL